MGGEQTDGTSYRYELEQAERLLAVVQEISQIGSWQWDVRTNVVRWSDQLFRIYGLQPQSRPVTFEFFLSCLHVDDRARIREEVGQALRRGGRFHYVERIVRPDGTYRVLDTIGETSHDGGGSVTGLIGTCRDVTELVVSRKLRDAEHQVLELIATGAPLDKTLEAIVLAVEEHSAPMIASVLLLDPDGTHLRHGVAPHLPAAYVQAIDGSAIGPCAGSCGTAAYRREPVYVADIATDPLWVDYRDVAAASDLRSCWSTPILSNDGGVLGTLALYYREPRAPTEEDRELVARATHLAGIAIEQRQLEEQLRALSGHVESVREDERTGIAREIHDVLGQSLTALKIDLSLVGRKSTGETKEKLAAMSDMTDEIIQQVRRISAELRPGMLDDLGLLSALEWQAHEFEARTGIVCSVSSNDEDALLPRAVSTALFRIFQESLTNVARHAEAKRVDIRLELAPDRARMEIADDGRGISAAALADRRSLGLLGIRERARRLGGSATIAPRQGRGTSVVVVVPVAELRRHVASP